MEQSAIKNLIHPSLLQIRYLMELERTGNRRGAVGTVANLCGVSHAPVSKFFKECADAGYLDSSNAFTEEGKKALNLYKRILREVEEYLGRIGIDAREYPEKVKQMVENLDYDLLLTIAGSDRRIREKPGEGKEEESGEFFIRNVLEMGKVPVCIAVHQLSRGGETRLSMAHRGFEHLAYVRKNNRGSWLELTICPMRANSRMDGLEMVGYLASLKYESQGQLFEAVIKDNKLQIPLSACRFIKSSHGNIKGMVMITVTCSVGKAHMPESTAILTFWM